MLSCCSSLHTIKYFPQQGFEASTKLGENKYILTSEGIWHTATDCGAE
jgi:hypothetical protein